MRADQKSLELVRRWRQAAVWSPVVWFPLVIYGLSVGRLALVIALVLSGILFASVCGAIVWFGHCPRCKTRYGGSRQGFRKIWDESTCAACGLSLFELRRGDPRM